MRPRINLYTGDRYCESVTQDTITTTKAHATTAATVAANNNNNDDNNPFLIPADVTF